MVPALIGAAASVGTGLLNQDNAERNAQIAFRNQKELMAMQQKYAVENWNREVNYNDPKQQMERLKAAGLNPNLIYGNGAAGLEAPSTAAPTAPSAPMAQTIPMENPITAGAQAALALANAKKAGSEKIKTDIENEYSRKTLEDRVRAVGLANKWTEEQTKKTIEEISNLQQQYGLLVGQQNILSTERQIRDKELANWDEQFNKLMREYDDKHNLSKEEYRRLRDTYDDFISITKAAKDKAEWDAKMSELLYQIDSDWKNTEKKLGALGTLLHMLKSILGK